MLVTESHENDAEWVTKDRRTQLSPRSSLTLERDARRSSSGGQIVTMMQAAESGHRCDLATHAGLAHRISTGRRALRQREMCPVVVVVTDVFIHQAFQMPFIENDHMVEQITAAVADPTLGNAILPRASEAGSLRFDTEALDRFDHFGVEVCTAIKDQVAGSGVIRERLAQLLNNLCLAKIPSAFIFIAFQLTRVGGIQPALNR